MKIDIDALAQEIRRVDGSNSLGAGALAEALMPFLSRTPANPTPPGWADPLESPQAEAIRNGKLDDTEIRNLFDCMERELRLHRERAVMGAGGQAVDRELRDAAKAMGAEVARNVPMVGAGGQAVDDPWSEVRELMEKEPKFDWDNNQEGAARQHFVDYTQRKFLDLLYGAVARSLDHPAPSGRAVALPSDEVERVVEIANRNEQSVEGDRLAVRLSAISNPSAQPGWRDMPAPIEKDIIVIWDDEKIEIIKADDNDFAWTPYPGKSDCCSRPVGWLPLDFLPAAPQPKGE